MICRLPHRSVTFFFFNGTPTTEIYTLSLHDALPISNSSTKKRRRTSKFYRTTLGFAGAKRCQAGFRSEEHTSELQSLRHLVCRLLLEKKNKKRAADDVGVYQDTRETFGAGRHALEHA